MELWTLKEKMWKLSRERKAENTRVTGSVPALVAYDRWLNVPMNSASTRIQHSLGGTCILLNFSILYIVLFNNKRRMPIRSVI